MMLGRISFGVVLLAAMAAAQTAPAAKPAVPPAPAKAPTVAATKTAVVNPAQAAKTAAAAPKPNAATPPAPKAKDSGAELTSASSGKNLLGQGRRDPFVSIIDNRGQGNPGCSTGKKCLVVDQIVLKGVVRGPAGMVAVVENSQRKTYFLRENDPVFNGQVTHITGDSIAFREKVFDKLGREHMRDVVKRLSAGA